ncbi:MAG TPA: hypothetical protein DDY14_09710 [Chromatiaceae bacterium]|jgi:hypothetical protein|nr:MAG: hypothetical protein N838_11740 [Thiohalocapsa sp. PB-PSB1]QQO52281.1 MAG: hypothetical protein N838_01665 [Thiohalocapsa sp. PB-PSB1]HBG95575.1 hypothetical protein [Chromatiaceae bacterium]HCS92921.1 hypothetical protein [Chromatiaceae bacterium]
METCIDRDIAQGKKPGEQRGEAKMLLRRIERKCGDPRSETIHQRMSKADSATPSIGSERILDAPSPDEVPR